MTAKEMLDNLHKQAAHLKDVLDGGNLNEDEYHQIRDEWVGVESSIAIYEEAFRRDGVVL
jgi:hypothetical protein